MTVEELKSAVLALSAEEKKAFIIATLPDLARDGMQDPSFMMQLLPVLMGLLKESNMDLQQLLQFAAMMNNQDAGK